MTSHTAKPLESGFVVFLFTDIQGSTARWERDPAAMGTAVARHDALLNEVMNAHGGHVFKTLGDGFCVAFGQPGMAVAAALAAQRALEAEDFSAVDGLSVRMAIHAGDVEAREGDYFGQPVNRVGRIVATAHGGQVVVSGVATDMVQGSLPPQATLHDLGQHRLKDLTNPEQIYQLIAPGLKRDFPPLRSLSSFPNNLPQQVTSFIGREAELQEIRSLLSKHPLVSLVGSGGLGKTRISLQVGADLMNRFQDGVWLLELAPLSNGRLVAETAASLLGLSIQASRSATEMVTTYLRDKRLLLILDNCEHVVAEAADLAAAIVGSCPSVKILASSREGLGVIGEFAYRMPSLSVPERPEHITAEQAMSYGAVRLFVERGQAAVGNFVLTDENAPAVAEICKRLDGIALAIELAAPRLKMLQPAGLLARLKDRFRLLTGGDRTALPRQQTLRALIDWSYVLLTRNEQMLLQRLSVFGGGWTIEAAAEVAGGEPIDGEDIFDLVASLVDKSLAMPIAGGQGDRRYRLLESTREYALEKLKASGDIDRPRVLAEYMVRLFDKADDTWQTIPTEAWMAQCEPELDNVRTALEWAFGPEGDPTLGAQLVSRTLKLLSELSLVMELRRWCEVGLAACTPLMPPDIEGSILLFMMMDGNFGSRRYEAPARRAVELFRSHGDPVGLAKALRQLGVTLARPGDAEEAEVCLREAEALLRPRTRTKEFANVLSNLAVVRSYSGDTASAMLLMQECLAISRRLGHRYGIELQASYLAEFEFSLGNYETAIARAREAEATCRRSGNRRVLVYVLGNLAGYMLAAGYTREARAPAVEVLHLARALGVEAEPLIWALEHLALIAALGGKAPQAASLLGYTSAWLKAEDKLRDDTEEATYKRLAAVLAEALEPEEYERLQAEGAQWSELQAVDMAIGITET